MELSFRILGALHLIYGWVLFGTLTVALDERSGIELPPAQWGIKTVLLLADIFMLGVSGAAALLLEPSAFVYAVLAMLASTLFAFSDTVALRGVRAMGDISIYFCVQLAIRGMAALLLFVLRPSAGVA